MAKVSDLNQHQLEGEFRRVVRKLSDLRKTRPSEVGQSSASNLSVTMNGYARKVTAAMGHLLMESHTKVFGKKRDEGPMVLVTGQESDETRTMVLMDFHAGEEAELERAAAELLAQISACRERVREVSTQWHLDPSVEERRALLESITMIPSAAEVDLEYLLDPNVEAIGSIVARAFRAFRKQNVHITPKEIMILVDKLLTERPEVIAAYRRQYDAVGGMPPVRDDEIKDSIVSSAPMALVINALGDLLGGKDLIAESHRLVATHVGRGVDYLQAVENATQQLLRKIAQGAKRLIQYQLTMNEEGLNIVHHSLTTTVQGLQHRFRTPATLLRAWEDMTKGFFALYSAEHGSGLDFEEMMQQAQTTLVDQMDYQFGPALSLYGTGMALLISKKDSTVDFQAALRQGTKSFIASVVRSTLLKEASAGIEV